MMQILRNLLQKTNSKPPLGRWTIERCNTKLDQKIDLANEDHCGPCGNIRQVSVIKVNESVNRVERNTNPFQLSIQKFLGICDIHKNMLNRSEIDQTHRSQRDQELNRTTANRRQSCSVRNGVPLELNPVEDGSCSARNGVPLELTIDHNNHNHQLNYLPVYFPAYTSPTFPPIYPPTHTPTYPNVRVCVPREK
jgi:hypothetical protein